MYSKLYWINDKTAREKNKRTCTKGVDNFCCLDKKDDIPAKTLNVSKHSSIAEHLVNPTCANSYNINRFKIIKTCSNIFDLI